MKKLWKIASALLLTGILAISVSAAEWITSDINSVLDDAPDWYSEDTAEDLEIWDLGDSNACSGAQDAYPSGYVYLKDKGLGDFNVPFEVSESGNYNIGFVLMAWSKSVPRSTNFSIDGAESIYLSFDYADEDQYSEQFVTGPSIYLEKGEHTLTLSLSSDFDNTNVKSLYFDKFFFALATEDTATTATTAEPAADEITYYTDYPEDIEGDEILFATGDMDMLSGYDAKGGIGTDLYNLASGGSAYCLKRDTSTWYDFEVSEKTDVTFYVGYIARTGSNRGLDYAVDDPNGENRVFMDLVENDSLMYASATFTVEAGKHSFYLYAPTAMDDSSLKSCDVYTIELYGVPSVAEAVAEAVEEAPAEVVEEPVAEPVAEEPAVVEEVAVEEEPAVEEEVVTVEEPAVEAETVEEPTAETAPQTFDFGIFAAISALVSLVGYAFSKKR